MEVFFLGSVICYIVFVLMRMEMNDWIFVWMLDMENYCVMKWVGICLWLVYRDVLGYSVKRNFLYGGLDVFYIKKFYI